MPNNLRRLCSEKTIPAVLATIGLGVLIVAMTTAEARVGVGRPGVGVGRVGSGLGFRPGVGVGSAGLGVRGWRNGVGYGRMGYGYGRYGYGRWGYRRYGYGAAALTGAALGYAAGNNYGYGYEEPYDYGYTGLYSYAPINYVASTPAPAASMGGGYALVQFTGGYCEVWSNGYPSGSGWMTLVDGLPSWDAGESAYHAARAQGVCHG